MSGDGGPLRLVHHHPGRIRARSGVFVGGDAALLRVRGALRALPGVLEVSHRAFTGSVLVEYDPGLAEPDDLLLAMASAAGLSSILEEGGANRDPAESGREVARGFSRLNATIGELTGGRTDLTLLVPIALASVSAYSLAFSKEDRLPRWDNLLWWSYSIFRDFHGRPRASEKPSGARPAPADPALPPWISFASAPSAFRSGG